jgi:diguanylate cyclase (GGDEF)-like protein
MIDTEAAATETTVAEERELARHEEAVGKVAWFGCVAVASVTLVCFIALVLTGDGPWWHFLLYALIGGVPLAYALFSTLVMRQMDLSVFNRYKQRLVGQLTDLHELVFKDELTGLFNRRHFYDKMRMEVDKARVSRQPLALIMLDLDGLKVINDEHGHAVGDAVLANLGRMIAEHTRSVDVPCRLGGDEFGIVMPGTDKRGAFALARRLWAGLEAVPMYQANGVTMNVTVSIGLAGYPWGGESVEEMMQWADADMYANKVSRKLAKEMAPIESQGSSDLESVPEDVFGSL